jgi:hypothetical protein
VNHFSLRGRLALNLRLEQGRVAGVEIDSTRPQAAVLLKGKTPQQAVHLAPLIFSLCGGAQGVAAQAALMAAQGGLADEAQLVRWAGAIRREASTEHLWRLMLDWPQICGLGIRETEYAKRLETGYANCRRLCLLAIDDREHASALQTVMHANLLGISPRDWLAQDAQAFAAWRANSSSLGAKLLRSLDNTACGNTAETACLPYTCAQDWVSLGQEIVTPEFCKLPTWRSEPHEVGALARNHAHARVAPLITNGRRVEARVLARIVELALWASGEFGQAQDWIDVAPCGPNEGLARVETARGVLIHRARVENGAIADYTVVAPTEWNFHPQGAFAREAGCIAAKDDAAVKRLAQGLALSLDPCVEYEVVLG